MGPDTGRADQRFHEAVHGRLFQYPGTAETARSNERRARSILMSAPAVRLWHGLPPFAQHLLKSLVIGLGAAMFLSVARPYLPAFNLAETAATDWAISFWRDRPAHKHSPAGTIRVRQYR